MTTASESTRERLLRAAAGAIARHGYRGASLREIAAMAEIRAASIFHYFPAGKVQLARAMLTHIMETIATRMTPTIDSSSDLPPADLIVRCTALLWDFMAQYPEYAGALMREAFEPDPAIGDVVRTHAERVIAAAIAYFEASQADGALAAFDVRRFLLRMASTVISFHGAPSFRQQILGPGASLDEERAAFLDSVRAELVGDS